MNEIRYSYLRHIGASLIAGLMFSLFIGLIFSFKVIGINEATHQFRYAYPFLLNFLPLYLLLGVIFGALVGVVGGILLRSPENPKGLGLISALAISYLAFVICHFILGIALGTFFGMLLATLTVAALSQHRPALHRLYFSVFLTSVFFNYSWQWVRQHFIVNPLQPVTSSKTIDLIFTLIWALTCLVGFRIFLKALLRFPAKFAYLTGTSLVVLGLLAGGIYSLVKPTPTPPAAINLEIERQPSSAKIIVVGIDGMWWKVINPLLKEEKLPHVQQLMSQGTSGPLATLFPTFSAAIWSSISTGKSPEKHNVTSFLVWRFPWTGFTLPCFKTPKITAELDFFRKHVIIVAPMTNRFLDATPIWSILSDHDVSVGTVNWWVSWPAEQVNGFIVTDHCLYNKEYVMQNFKEKEGDTPYDIYPAELLPELIEFSRSPNDLSEAEIRRFINITDPVFLEEFRAIATYDYLDIAYEASMFKYSYPEDATFAPTMKYLIATHPQDFMCVYLDGMDSMQHQYLKYYFWEQHPDKLIPENLERYKDLINNYYIYIDEVIGSFMEAADPNTIFMVISDHGFDEVMLPSGHYNHMDSPPGVFICAGPGIKQNHRVEDAHVFDITPTILHLFGLPVAQDFDGKVLTDIFENQTPPSVIPTYDTGRRAGHELMQSDIDDSYKDKLKALGYTQ